MKAGGDNLKEIEIEIEPRHLELANKLFRDKPILPRQAGLHEFKYGPAAEKNEYFAYREIRKREKEKIRIIYVPSPRLKRVQRKLLGFLKKIWGEWHANYCGLHHGSPMAHAIQHEGSRYIFQFDIKDAFASVNTGLLRKALLEKISEKIWCYNKGVERYKLDRDYLEKELRNDPDDAISIRYLKEHLDKSRRNVIFSPFYRIFGNEKVRLSSAEELTDAIMAFVTIGNVLPQGTPTAPFLFYVYIVENQCINRIWTENCHASCYVDGFVISGKDPLPEETREKIPKSLEDLGLRANDAKTRYQDCRHGAVMITGLAVDSSGKVRLPKKIIRKWRGIMHRAMFESDEQKRKEYSKKINGFMASLKPVYGKNIPKQIAAPFEKLQRSYDLR